MSAYYPQQRIYNLARKLGVTVHEAAVICGRKGARARRERARQCACAQREADEEARIRAARWDLRHDFEEDAA